MDTAKVMDLLAKAPKREFENKVEVTGYFQQELVAMGISKSVLKRLYHQGSIKMGSVGLKDGNRNFYTLETIKK